MPRPTSAANVAYTRAPADFASRLRSAHGQLTSYPQLRPLVIVLKLFLARHELNDPSVGGLGSRIGG